MASLVDVPWVLARPVRRFVPVLDDLYKDSGDEALSGWSAPGGAAVSLTSSLEEPRLSVATT